MESANLCEEVTRLDNHCDISQRAPSEPEPAPQIHPTQPEEPSDRDQCRETSSHRGQVEGAAVNHDNVTMETGTAEEEEDEDSWDKLFTDDGDCLDPKIMEEVSW